jgi:hypothetical protein
LDLGPIERQKDPVRGNLTMIVGMWWFVKQREEGEGIRDWPTDSPLPYSGEGPGVG